MAKKIVESEQNRDLRSQAEELLRDGRGNLAGSKADEGRDTQSLVHELQVHQIELEMQNEELKRTKLEAENAMTKYFGLYDFAPIGLFTLNEQGKIKEVNLAGSALLGRGRRNLLDRRFLQFVAPEDRRSFNEFCKSAFETSAKQTGELGLVRDDESTLYTHIECTATNDSLQSVRHCLISVTDISERKRAEEELRQSQEKYRQLVEGSGSVILLVDKDMRITFMNQYGLQFFGYSPEEIIGKGVLGTIIPIKDDEGHDMEAMAEDLILHPDNYPTNVHQNIRKDGRLVWMSWTNKPIYDDQGNLVEILAIGNDLTKLKEAEEALRKSEQRFKDAIDNFPNVLVIYDSDRRVRYINSKGLQIIGRSEQEVVGRRDEDLFPPEMINSYLPALKHAIETKTPQMLERTRHTSMGGQVIIINIIPLRDENGNVHQILGITHDITERKQMEEELRKAKDELEQRVYERTAELMKSNLALAKSEDRFRVALKNSPITVFNQDRDLRYTWVYHATPGFTVDTSLGKTDEELLSPEDAAQLTKIKRRVLESGIGERVEAQTTVNGEKFYYDLTVEPLRNAAGEIEGITCSAMDITYRKKAEEELRKSMEAAKAAVEAKAAFLANMSHEIRTPMNSIIGFTELLLDEPLTPEQRDNLETIRINGDALLTIINDILDFSKMESDKVVLEECQFNLRSCVEESLDLVAIKAAEKGINLAYTIEKDVPDTIIGDFGRLRQILGNLLSNAVKFTDEGEVTLAVLADSANEIHFAVKDTGIGIPPESMSLLFQPFNQMEPSTTRLYGGTGLGLVISRKLVELMGGKIWADSEVGKGSTFHFTIKVSSELGSQPVEVLPQLIGKRVLIIEDNKTNRRILGKQVYDWGMIPMVASSGQEALKYIRRGDDFDIVILDMDLQTMDSLELEEEIRKYNKNQPLVLLTSLGKRIPPNHAYLTKPIKPSQMHKVLTEILPKTVIMPKEPDKRPTKASAVDQPIQFRPLKILLAEDNVSSQKVALQMLKKLGYKADIVANGIEALQALERQHYDIVLMDVRMPEMDGLEATRIIRQRWPDNGPKIIATTAYALEGDREKCLEAGMDDYISKPIQKEDLARALKDINRL